MKKMIILVCISTLFILLNFQFTQAQEIRIVENGGTGDYSAIMMADPGLPTHTIFRPKDMEAFGKGKMLPVIAWGNGACNNSPWEHYKFLNEIASHGFLVIAIGTIPKESGEQNKDKSESRQLIDAIDWAIAQNSNRQSAYYNKLDTAEIAVSGMSCGGLQALEVCGDPRIATLMVCNSGIFKNPVGRPGVLPQLGKDHLQKIHTPAIYLLGGPSDIAYENGMDDYAKINHVPVFVGNLDVGHGGTYSQPHGGEFARVATKWFKWQLQNDSEAGKMFTGNPCGLSMEDGWKVKKKNMP